MTSRIEPELVKIIEEIVAKRLKEELEERSKLVTKDDFKEALDRMDKRFGALIEQMNKGFEEARKEREQIRKETDERFKALIEQMNKGFEEARKEREQIRREMDERFKALIEQMNKGFEEARKAREQIRKETDERFKALIEQMNKGFEEARKERELLQIQMDKRFEALRKEWNERFEASRKEIDERFEEARKEREQIREQMNNYFREASKERNSILNILRSIQEQIGKPFEQFARNVIIRILEGEGFKNVKLKAVKFEDKDYSVFEDTSDIQIDGYSEDPPVIVEITSILHDTEKGEKLIKKKKFVEKLTGKKFRGFLVAASCEIDQTQVADLIVKLREHNCELINL
ncbi:MAG: hypothetical protein ACP6IY_05520 [Promethearchaeia archaeon]